MNRRGFVMGGAAASLQRVKGANERVTLALVGCGGRGGLVARGLARQPGVEFAYVCEVNELRGHDFAEEMEAQMAPEDEPEVERTFHGGPFTGMEFSGDLSKIE